MSEGSVITEEVRRRIGVQSEPLILEAEKGAIRKFAEAVEDSNPRWQEEAPPNFLCTVMAGAGQRVSVPHSLKRGVAGGDELEIYRPVRPGDVITSVGKVHDIYEREGKGGSKMLFIIQETTFTNQRGEVVAKDRSSAIFFA